MQQTEGVAILATQLAGSDRRALSQAWYSALHLAQADAPHGVRPALRSASRDLPVATSAVSTGSSSRSGAAASIVRAQARQAPAAPASALGERRAVRTRFERSLERAVSRRVDRGACGSFSLSAENGRVQVLVRTERGTTRVVALCAPSLRERVERALAHVRFAVSTGPLTPSVRA
jgi:hypothetical protein